MNVLDKEYTTTEQLLADLNKEPEKPLTKEEQEKILEQRKLNFKNRKKAVKNGLVVGGIGGTAAVAMSASMPVAAAVGAGFATGYAGYKLGVPAGYSILDIGNPEGSQGMLGKFIERVAKWGENDIPKEFKTVLDIYDKGLNILGKASLEPLLAVLSIAWTLRGEGWNSAVEIYKKSSEKRKEEANKLILEKQRELLSLAYFNNDGDVNALLEAQQKIIEDSFNFGTVEDNKAFQEENLPTLLGLSVRELDDVDKFTAGIQTRRETQTIVSNILSNSDIAGESYDKIAKVYAWLSPDVNSKNLNEKEVKAVNDIVGELDESKRERLLKELLRIYPAVIKGRTVDEIFASTNRVLNYFDRFNSVNEKRDDPNATQLEKDNERLQNAEKLENLKDFLATYRIAMINGEALSLVKFNDDLSMPNMMPADIAAEFRRFGFPGGINPFINLGFVNKPTESQVYARAETYHSLNSNVPDIIDFTNTFSNFYRIYKDPKIIENNLKTINTLSRKQLEGLNSLTQLYLQNNGVVNPVRISYQGETLEMDANNPILQSLRNALRPRGNNINPRSENIIYRPSAIQDLIIQLEDKPELSVLKNLLEEINNIPLLMTDLIFGSSEQGFANSTINFIKNLNSPASIFQYLFILNDGELPPLDKMSVRDAASYRVSVKSLLNLKEEIAIRLLEAYQDIWIDEENLFDTHIKHLKRINNGDIVIQRNILNGRDHLGYLAELEVINGDMVENLTSNDYSEIAELSKEFDIKPNMLQVSDLTNRDEFNKLKLGLSKIGKVLYLRMGELVRTEGDVESHNFKTVNEIKFIHHYLSILNTLGFDPKDLTAEDCINDKLLKMYLNGYDLKLASRSFNTYDENVGQGAYSLTLGGSRLSFPPVNNIANIEPAAPAQQSNPAQPQAVAQPAVPAQANAATP